jgi:hypothetical protein
MASKTLLFAATLFLAAPAHGHAQTPRGNTLPDQPGASEFAPGQRATTKRPAKTFAPGQKAKATGQPAKTFAPGQQDDSTSTGTTSGARARTR